MTTLQGTKPLLSVIIPVYNTEKYLNKCVQSVVNQTYSNLEIILINDGSTDNSPTICDEWAKKDSRIRVIHKENGGQSTARNVGLDIMTGTLVGFVDSDDYIAPDMYEKLYNAMIDNDADLSVSDSVSIDENGNQMPKRYALQAQIISGREALANIYPSVNSIPWNKLYKSKIFDSLRFVEGFIHEDEIIVHHILGQCNKIAVIDDITYFVVKNVNSTTAKASRGTGIIRSFKCQEYAMRDRYDYLDKLGISLHETIKYSYGFLVGALIRVNYLQYRREISPVLRDVVHKLIKPGKFTYWLRAVKLAFVLFSSIFRPFINEEQKE